KEIGTGYYDARTEDADIDPAHLRDHSARDQVKCVYLKLSQDDKPGIGRVQPASRENAEIEHTSSNPRCLKNENTSANKGFTTPIELIEFIARMRELSGGKPAGFKLCVGSRTDVLAICKAMLEVGTAPDFIIVDGSEGGSGAAPLEYEDHVGAPLTDG